MKYRVLALACSALVFLPGGIVAEVPSVIAIRGARIVTVSGPVIPRGTVILRDGLIEAVGDAQPPRKHGSSTERVSPSTRACSTRSVPLASRICLA